MGLQRINLPSDLLGRLQAKFAGIMNAASVNGGAALHDRVVTSLSSDGTGEEQCSPKKMLNRICCNVQACVSFLEAHNHLLTGKGTPLTDEELIAQWKTTEKVEGLIRSISFIANGQSAAASSRPEDIQWLRVLHQQSEIALNEVRNASVGKASSAPAVNESQSAAESIPSNAPPAPIEESKSQMDKTMAAINEVMAAAANWIADQVKDSPRAQGVVKTAAVFSLAAMWAVSLGFVFFGPMTGGVSALIGASAIGVATAFTHNFFNVLWEALKYPPPEPVPAPSVAINNEQMQAA